jgi:hypothetical protein
MEESNNSKASCKSRDWNLMIQSTSHVLLLGIKKTWNSHLHGHVASSWGVWHWMSQLLLCDVATRLMWNMTKCSDSQLLV